MHRESIFAADVWIRVEHIVPAKACKSIEVSLLELTYLVLCLQILLCFYGHHSDMTLFGNVSCGVNTKASSTKSWTASLATTPRTSFLDVTQMTPAHRVVWKVLARAGHWNLQYRSIWFIMNVKFQTHSSKERRGEYMTFKLFHLWRHSFNDTTKHIWSSKNLSNKKGDRHSLSKKPQETRQNLERGTAL